MPRAPAMAARGVCTGSKFDARAQQNEELT